MMYDVNLIKTVIPADNKMSCQKKHPKNSILFMSNNASKVINRELFIPIQAYMIQKDIEIFFLNRHKHL